MAFTKDSHIIVVGAGVFGLSSAYNLVQNGYKNIDIFDRTDYEKTKYSPFQGSDAASADINKLFRIYYETKTLYSKLAIDALDIWDKWNEEIQTLSSEEKSRFIDDDLELIRLTGGLRVGNLQEPSLVEVDNLKGFEELGLRDTQFDLSSEKDLLRAKLLGWDKKLDIIRDLKARNKVTTVSGTLDGITRILKADKALFYVKILLEKAGVIFHYGDEGTFSELIYDDRNKSVVRGIRTANGSTHSADVVIVSSGPWTTSLVPQLQHRTQASLANIVYLEIPKSRQDLIDKYSEYPQLQWKTTSSESDFDPDGGFAFFPPSKSEGILKLNGRHLKYLNPVKIGDSYISVPKTLGDEKLPKFVLQEAKEVFLALTPEAAAIEGVKLKSKLFWYTDSINSDFVIDFVPNFDNLLVATGGSSHGFKFFPVLGRTVVDRLQAAENDYTELFKWKNPEDIKVDTFGLKEEHIENNERLNLKNAVLLDDSDLEFSKEDLSRIASIKLV
ncbi:uncharacterized protein PRCAT00003827001 [Priceomyces carsonii]|uniref:uncharacterized protein n=1 Tax=Priceomyces carsonii TaxID=28549 RepID=UPI002ED8572C|nr:unnamed protein product [Priceomyces carsonii]